MAASYRIGPTDTFTGGDLLADANTLNVQVNALDAQTEGVPGISADLLSTWINFQGDWGAFYAGTFDSGQSGAVSNFLTALNDANRDQLIQYETRFADIAAQFKAVGIYSAAVDVAVSLGAGDTITATLASLDSAVKSAVPSLGIGIATVLVCLAGLYVAWRFLK